MRHPGSGVVQLLAYGRPGPAVEGWLTRLNGGGILSLALHVGDRYALAMGYCYEAACRLWKAGSDHVLLSLARNRVFHGFSE